MAKRETAAERKAREAREQEEQVAAYVAALPVNMLAVLAEVEQLGGNRPGFNFKVVDVDGVLTLKGMRTVYDAEQEDGDRLYDDTAEVRLDSTKPYDLHRLRELLDAEWQVRKEAERRAAVRADALAKLKGLDLTVEQKEMFGLSRKL
jgi:hypothetical protein